MGRRVYAKWGGAGENVDRELNIVAGWKVAECALRDVMFTPSKPIGNFI
jgi:hypothetical protein